MDIEKQYELAAKAVGKKDYVYSENFKCMVQDDVVGIRTLHWDPIRSAEHSEHLRVSLGIELSRVRGFVHATELNNAFVSATIKLPPAHTIDDEIKAQRRAVLEVAAKIGALE